MRVRQTAVIALFSLVVPAAAAAQHRSPPGLDAYVARVMQAFDVPGIAVAIVKDGEVVLARGYGVRRLGNSQPVDDHTLFGIASNTKAFTATALGLLVEEGKLGWDDRVIDHLPWFQMYDPWTTRELTIRDLLVHRSGLGLGAGDLLWWPPTTYDRTEIARRLRYIQPVASFRSAYAYDNVLYNVAGEVIETVSGMSWEEFVQRRIVDVVGMSESNVRGSLGARGANVATPHAPIDGEVKPVRPFASDVANPAGGINASVHDLARWMIVQLDSGRLRNGDGRLFSARTARELWTGVTPTPNRVPAPELAPYRANFTAYALGFGVRDYRGEKLVTHTGGLPGYVSRLAMIPDHKLGVVVLTNMESGAAFNAIAWHVLDYYLEAPPHDWLAGYRIVTARFDSAMSALEQTEAASRDTASRPSLPLSDYTGGYTDDWYGDVTISHEGDRLVLRFMHTPVLVADLEYWQYDTFIARWRDRELRADAYVTFHLNPDGSIHEVLMRAVSPRTDFSFDFHDLRLHPTH